VLFTDGDQKFIFMNNQTIYRTSALAGAFLGVALGFCVLLLATRSVLIAVLSSCSITCTMLTVIGTTTMLGWELGTIEAILISILAGFSVDYVAHLAHAYSHHTGTNEERLRLAFSEMGTPVFSGMLTSMLASLPLFLCQILFFAKFGTFLCFTILASWFFANFGFMSVLASVGPSKQVESEESKVAPEEIELQKNASPTEHDKAAATVNNTEYALADQAAAEDK
jgi:predicted RND superfamily exporter protein